MNETLEILEKLIAFDTASYKSNNALIQYARDYLSQYNVKSDLFFNGDQSKANIVAKVGDGLGKGVVLSGHTDVVPVAGQHWDMDPFSLMIKDGKAFGRGTCDMKGFIASALAAVPGIIQADLPCPVYLVFSYDEEVGCVGVRDVLENLPFDGRQIRASIIGEPTGMKPVTAHTGKQVIELKFRGAAMHSSLSPKGVNAISYAGKVICGITQLQEEAKKEQTSDRRFEFPYPTINIGTISGGKAVNIVAQECSLEIECRYPPGSSANAFRLGLDKIIQEQALTPMREIYPGADVSLTDIVSYPAFTADPHSEAVQLVRKITGSNDEQAVNYGTEAGLFQERGLSAVVCGPGDIAQAHQPNEFVELSQLEACDQFLAGLTSTLAGHGDV